jgi:DNA polymerase-3 subunit alpha
LDIAKRLGAPACATMDSHYTHKHSAHAHDILLCCQTGAKQSDEKRFRFHNDEYYLKSPEEMRTIFSQNPEVCDNTLLIAEKVDVTIDFDTLHLPRFEPPAEYKDDYDYLERMVFAFLSTKYGDDQRYHERVAYELSVIRQLNLSSYFLIFWDLVEFTKREGILTGPGRGSAAGSLVSHLLGITKLDPIKYDLLFERFINPDRMSIDRFANFKLPINQDDICGKRSILREYSNEGRLNLAEISGGVFGDSDS